MVLGLNAEKFISFHVHDDQQQLHNAVAGLHLDADEELLWSTCRGCQSKILHSKQYSRGGNAVQVRLWYADICFGYVHGAIARVALVQVQQLKVCNH